MRHPSPELQQLALNFLATIFSRHPSKQRPSFSHPMKLICICGFFYSVPAAWNTLPSDLHDITDTSTFRKRLKNVLFDRAYNWLLLALLDESYSGALQISRWLIDWLIVWALYEALSSLTPSLRQRIWPIRTNKALYTVIGPFNPRGPLLGALGVICTSSGAQSQFH